MSSPPTPSPDSSASSSAPAGAQSGQFRIWTDKTANRLIIAAHKAKFAEIERLINLLDTQKPQDVSIRVLPLKNVSAEDLVRELGPLFLKMSGKSLKESIEVSANSRANSLIILSSEANFKAIEALAGSLDTENAQERALQAFPLKNADAEDVARQLQELNTDQGSQNRFPYYIYSSSPMGKSPVKPTFVADRRRNTVIVQAAPANLAELAKLIEELDQPITDEGLAPKIFRLKYVSAVDIEEILNELFIKRQQQRTYWDPYSGYPTRETDQQGSGRLSGKVRITSEPYANAIIVTAVSPEILTAVENVLKELDVPSQAGETTFRVGLRYAKATTVANGINILFARGGSPPLRNTPQPGQPGNPPPQQQQAGTPPQNTFELEQETQEETYYPWLGGQAENQRSPDGRTVSRPVSDLVGRVRVVPDPRSNSLLISANLHLYPQVLKLIQDMDAPTPQVLIEAKILEVSSDYLERLGVRWSPNGGATFTAEDLDNSLIANTRGSYRQGFGGQTTVNTEDANGIANALTSLRSGTISSMINLDFLVQFLRKTTEASVLGEPQINVADNEVGKLFVGQQVPFIERSQSTDVGALNQTFSYKNVGVILEVTPHINTSGDVALKIRAESSSIVPGQTLFGGAILDTRNFKTDVTVKDGETLVLGGIIQRQISNTLRKTPVLGSIPGVGWLFKKKDDTQREVELMVFLRPRVMRTPEEAKALLEEVEKKVPLMKKQDLRTPNPEEPNKKQR
jgi:general secretion pathway protein D